MSRTRPGLSSPCRGRGLTTSPAQRGTVPPAESAGQTANRFRLTVRNLHRGWPVDTRGLRSIGEAALEMLRWAGTSDTSPPVAEAAVDVFLVGARRMAELNERYLGHAGPTDVITFDYAESSASGRARLRPSRRPVQPDPARPEPRPTRFLATAHGLESVSPSRRLQGDIFICLEEARRQARAYGTTWPAEVVRYLVHGLLHLCGHDDLEAAARRSMKRIEHRLVRRLAAEFAFSRLRKQANITT